MSLQNNMQYAVLIKDEYLPPPLENNYLSLFDIQVKMAKEFISGTQQQKAAIIKKRIKKFFDYGNQNSQTDELNFEPKSNSKSQYPPFQSTDRKVKENLQIDCSKLILYGKQSATFQIAEKLFPTFIGYQKVDNCNVKLSFATVLDCQNLLLKNAKHKGVLLTQHIRHPYEIQWFQLQEEESSQTQQVQPTFYARFVTNKDDILFQNDNYFRKLLGKARHLIDKKREEQQQKVKQIEEKAERKAERDLRKKFTVKRYEDKNYSKDYDMVTNYDGVYTQRPYQRYQNSRQKMYYESRDEQWDRRYQPRMRHFDDLDVSAIRPRPNQFERNDRRTNNFKRDCYRSSSRDSVQMLGHIKQKKRPQIYDSDPRGKMIKSYRDGSSSKSSFTGEFLKSCDYDKEVERKLSKVKKPFLEID